MAFFFKLLLLVHAARLAVSPYVWEILNTSLPKGDKQIAVGKHNNSIWIIGGYNNRAQRSEYHMHSVTFTDYSDINRSTIYGTGQFWTQYVHTLYMIDPSGWYLNTYNMDTLQYTPHWKDITFNTHVAYTACLASSDEYLYIVGGMRESEPGASSYWYNNHLQALSLLSFTWINGNTMTRLRIDHSCIVLDEYLFAFGGREYGAWLDTVERINITDIKQKDWIYVSSLTKGIKSSRSVILFDLIYIIGGWYLSSGGAYTLTDIVHIYDPYSDVMTSDTLPFAVTEHGVVAVDDAIYVFGGQGNYYGVLKFMEPTASPTSAPTVESKAPTLNPTISPTSAPSNSPTIENAARVDGETTQNNESDDIQQESDRKQNKSHYIWIITGCILSVIVLVFGVIYSVRLYRKHKESKQLGNRMEVEVVEEDVKAEAAANAKADIKNEKKMDDNMKLEDVMPPGVIQLDIKQSESVDLWSVEGVESEKTTKCTTKDGTNNTIIVEREITAENTMENTTDDQIQEHETIGSTDGDV